MAAEFSYFKNPPQPGDKNPLMHPRVIVQGTKTTADLAFIISECSTFSSADTKGVLEALGKWVPFYLKEGYNVELEGIGLFSISVQGPLVDDPKKVMAPDVHFKDVNFRTSLQLKEKLKFIKFEHKPLSKTTFVIPEKRKQQILTYLKNHPAMSRTTCMQLNRCSKHIAIADLNELIAGDLIEKLGDGRTVLYVLKSTDNKTNGR